MKKRYKHLNPGSYASDVLIEIGDTLFDICEGLEYPNIAAFHGLEAVQEFKRGQCLAQKRQAMHRLKRAKFLKVNKMADTMISKMSEDGLGEYLYQKIMKVDLLPNGRFCLVIFDIPEDRRDIRAELRRILGRAGFIPIQKSVWASPFNAAKELSKFFQFKDRRKWVRIFTADENQIVPH